TCVARSTGFPRRAIGRTGARWKPSPCPPSTTVASASTSRGESLKVLSLPRSTGRCATSWKRRCASAETLRPARGSSSTSSASRGATPSGSGRPSRTWSSCGKGLSARSNIRRSAARLSRALEQLARVRRPPGGWEVLVVNNNSTDETERVLGAFEGRLPLRRAFEPQQGLSHARNHAVAQAAGEYIVWTDDDVLV